MYESLEWHLRFEFAAAAWELNSQPDLFFFPISPQLKHSALDISGEFPQKI